MTRINVRVLEQRKMYILWEKVNVLRCPGLGTESTESF